MTKEQIEQEAERRYPDNQVNDFYSRKAFIAGAEYARSLLKGQSDTNVLLSKEQVYREALERIAKAPTGTASGKYMQGIAQEVLKK